MGLDVTITVFSSAVCTMAETRSVEPSNIDITVDPLNARLVGFNFRISAK